VPAEPGSLAVTVNVEELAVPDGVVTVTGPLVAPVGTVAFSEVSELTVNVAPVPLNATAVVPVNPEPLTRSDVPGCPLLGANEEIVGAAPFGDCGRNAATLLGIPPGVPSPVGPS